jgi:hypothetical protein
MCFFTLAEEECLEPNDPFSTLKTMICTKDSFQKLTPFPEASNVLDPPASNTEGVLWRKTSVSSVELNRTN